MDNNIKVRVTNPDRISLYHGIEEGDELMTTRGYKEDIATIIYEVMGMNSPSGKPVVLYEEEVEEI